MAPEGSILVTGTNGTLGFNIVSQIVGDAARASKYHGLYTVRKVDGATNLDSVLKKAPKTHKHDVIALQLDRLQSVREVAVDINKRVASGEIPPIRALIWNAGFQEPSTLTMTEDGYDMTFQANYLSHWLLTVLLLQSMDKEYGRVVVVGSWTHDTGDERNKMGGPDYYSEAKWKTLFTNTQSLADGSYSPPASDKNGMAGMRRYGASKLCEVMMINELQERLDKDPALFNISVIGVDPRGMMTQLMRHGSGWLSSPLFALLVMIPVTYLWSLLDSNSLLRLPSRSAYDVLRGALASTPPFSERPKRLYFDGHKPASLGEEARDPAKTKALWQDSVKLTNLKESETILKMWN